MNDVEVIESVAEHLCRVFSAWGQEHVVTQRTALTALSASYSSILYEILLQVDRDIRLKTLHHERSVIDRMHKEILEELRTHGHV